MVRNTVPAPSEWKLRSAEEQALRHPKQWEESSEPRKAPMWAVFHIETGKQLCKSVHHREVAIIEAYELGLIVRGRGKVWLGGDYEIREV